MLLLVIGLNILYSSMTSNQTSGLEPVFSYPEKIMYDIVLQTIFHKYKTFEIKTSFVSSGLRPLGAKKSLFKSYIFLFYTAKSCL